jgi:hypothetical protein
MLVFQHNCVDTIRTFPVLQHDPLKYDDIDTTMEDHAADETRYACCSRSWIAAGSLPPADIQIVARDQSTVLVRPPSNGWLADLDDDYRPHKSISLAGKRIA